MIDTALPPAFERKVRTNTGCEVWTGAQNSKGYACIWLDGKSQLAHRVAYETLVGPIPEGMTLDHTCRVRNCVNVEHLEIVTVGENTRRARALGIGGECAHGHVQTEQTLYVAPRGSTECRVCRDERMAVRS